jgi:hypothetical protein
MASDVAVVTGKDALIEILKKYEFEWEIYVDEDKRREEIYASGAVDGIRMLVVCKPTECKIEAPDYHAAAPCYAKPEPADMLRCILTVIERVKELEKKTEKLLETAEKLKEYGFKVEKTWNGVIAEKFVRDGYIEVYFPFNVDTNVLKIELKAKSPAKLVIVATELAELFEQLQM